MNTVISVRLDKEVKEAAQEVAKSVGIPLSTLIGAYLRQLADSRRIELYAPEQMTPHLEKLIAEVEEDLAAGKTEGPFDTTEDFLDALHKKPD